MATVSLKDGISKLSKNNLIATIGDELFFRDQIKSKIIKDNPDYEIVKLDAKENEEKDIIDYLSFKDLFDTKKIFIIKNFTKLKNLKFLTEKKFTDLILLDSDKKGRSKDFKELEKKILFIDCSKPKPWHQEDDAANKIKSYLNKSGFIIHDDVSRYLFSQIGYNLHRLMKEMQKIMMLKENDSNKIVTKEDIDTICTLNLNYNIFDIIDNILDNNKIEALSLMNRLFVYESSPAILLISLWYSHFETLLLCKKKRNNEAEIYKYVKMPPLVVKNKLIPQSRKIATTKIIESMDYLVKADLNLRKGSFNLKFYLENFVINF